MFAQKIQNIESQIQELTRKADQYRLLDSEMIAAIEAIAKVQNSAARLDTEVADEVRGEILKALNLPSSQGATDIPKLQLLEEEVRILEQVVGVKNDKERVLTGVVARLQDNVDCYDLAEEHWELLKNGAPNLTSEDLLTNLEEVAQSLNKTPGWCLQARLNYVFDATSPELRMSLTPYLSEEVSSVWRLLCDQANAEVLSDDDAETGRLLEEALNGGDDTETRLMQIANVLDATPESELQEKISHFVRNMSGDLSDRLFKYLPLNLRSLWTRERDAFEQEARASILPPARPEIKPGDSVQIHSGKTCAVVQIEDIGGRTYVEIKTPSGRKEAYRDTDLKLVDKVEPEQWVNLVDDEEEDCELGMGDDWEQSISDAASVLDPATEQQEELFELDDIVQVPGGAVATIQSIDFVGAAASYSLRMPNGKNQSGFKVSDLKKMGKIESPTPQQSQRAAEVKKLAQTCLTKRSWSQIRTLCDREILQEMKAIASTSAEKRLINNLPSLISGYIRKSGDKSDLKWLPEDLLDEVEQLISGNNGLDKVASTKLQSRGVAVVPEAEDLAG